MQPHDPNLGARTGTFRAVPRELIGREVSVRALIPLWDAVRAKGGAPERLAIGTGYPISHFKDPRERVSWAALWAALMCDMPTRNTSEAPTNRQTAPAVTRCETLRDWVDDFTMAMDTLRATDFI